MPELAEVARIVHFIRKELVGKRITKVLAQHDDLIFGKVGTSADEFQRRMLGKTISGTGQQGKYFWMAMSSPPHPVMHFGMTGWLKIKGEETYYHPENNTDGRNEEWPPKFWKFQLETEDDTGSKKEAAFTDARRLGRVRLVDCPSDEIRDNTPLKENGPDPVADKQLVTEQWLRAKLSKKKVPVKAFLLDQAQISGLGNWMGDEILYHAQVHPEQYTDTLGVKQVKELYSAIHYVSSTSVDLLGDASQFPTDWLFNYRWHKRKNAKVYLPNGDEVVYITVGGRTSAVVPAVQFKTGPLAKELSGQDDGEEETKSAAKPTRGKRAPVKKEDAGDAEAPVPTKTAPKKPAPRKPAAKVKKEDIENDAPAKKPPARKRKAVEETSTQSTAQANTTAKKTKAAAAPLKEPAVGLRRGRSAVKKSEGENE